MQAYKSQRPIVLCHDNLFITIFYKQISSDDENKHYDFLSITFNHNLPKYKQTHSDTHTDLSHS